MNEIPSTDSASSTPTGTSSAGLDKPLTPQRCLVGSAIAGVMAYGMYLMTNAIVQSFAAHKIHATSLAVQRISSAVRTLVVGMTTLGLGVFGLAAVGLFALAIQLMVRRLRPQ